MHRRAFLVFRPLNLLILALTQFLVFYFLNPSPALRDLSDPTFLNFLKLVFGSMVLAAAGYLINDLFDRTTDRINKPDKNYIKHWSKPQINIVYLLLNAIGLVVGAMISWTVFQVFLTTSILLYLYSARLQKLAFVGNFVVAFLAALALLVIKAIAPETPSDLLLFYAGFAFLVSFIRELIKDLEDIEGDQTAGYKTAAIILPNVYVKVIIVVLSVAGILLYFSALQNWLYATISDGFPTWSYLYHGLFVAIPFLLIIYLIGRAHNKEHFHLVSSLCKYLMYTGMLGMTFF